MGLPISTTKEDIEDIINFLQLRPQGATMTEAKTVLAGKSVLDPRKIKSFIDLDIISKNGNTINLTEFGEKLSRSTPKLKISLYYTMLHRFKPYHMVLETIFHQNLEEITNVSVVRIWVRSFKSDLGTDSENTMKNMVVCFFHLCQAAEIGTMIIGRKGLQTRLKVDRSALQSFLSERALISTPLSDPESFQVQEDTDSQVSNFQIAKQEPEKIQSYDKIKPRIFISHSNDIEIVDQIKTMLDLSGMDCEIAEEKESTAIPVPEKVLEAMRKCCAAIICVTSDEKEKRDDGTFGINQNVLIEIGAAFVLYDKKVVLVWDKKVAVPSNLQGLYRCEYSGSELSWSTGMKLMKAISHFNS